MIDFFVGGTPIAQPRHRVSTRGGFAKMYLPTKHPVKAWKELVALSFCTQLTGAIKAGPIHITLSFFLPRPKQITRKTKPNPRLWHTGKPDSDNLIKAVQDALTGLAWTDDAQVCSLRAEKFICSGDDAPGVQITIDADCPPPEDA